MSNEFWLGVIVTLVGGAIVAELVNLAHPKILAFLDSRKLVSIEKRKRTATKLHSLIVELHRGRRDRHLYMLQVAIRAVAALLLGMIMTGCAAVILALSSKPPEPLAFDYTLKPLIFTFAMSLLGSFGVALAWLMLQRFREITNALDNFEEYDAAFKKKWGP